VTVVPDLTDGGLGPMRYRPIADCGGSRFAPVLLSG